MIYFAYEKKKSNVEKPLKLKLDNYSNINPSQRFRELRETGWALVITNVTQIVETLTACDDRHRLGNKVDLKSRNPLLNCFVILDKTSSQKVDHNF